MARTPRDRALGKAQQEHSLRMMLLPGACCTSVPHSCVKSSVRVHLKRQYCLGSTHAVMCTQGGREAHHEGLHEEWYQEGEQASDTSNHSKQNEAANPGGQQVLYRLYGYHGQASLLCHVWHTK